ncbi:Ribonuclease H-like domain containing protein [Senna tora]|uniref:Ribonuclease H-like domain containing protein n=1 Tax=Senna tora TaxID=362788 RepID=A0A834X506_9FABA|nr:Ribonuclease H-like domain containing protein [Senna tora]
MSAQCGYRPSMTWRSLMAGKPLLAKGLRRSIGDGQTTWVWKDPWVPSEAPIILAPPSYPTPNVVKVCELLNAGGDGWDTEKLRVMFDEDVCCQILSIPPDKEQGGDRWVWSMIREAYTLLREESRGLRINENCIMCNNAPEDVFHVVIDCPELQYMWVEANYDYSIRVFHANVLEWLVVETGEWKEEQIAALAIATYFAWERRNKKKFNNEIVRVEELWNRVERVMDETQVALSGDDRHRECPVSLVWEKPVRSFVKVNIDDVAMKDGGGVMGGLVRDDTGCCLGVFMNLVHYPNDPIKLEAMAVKRGLELALKIGSKNVIVEGDAKLVMELLQTPCDQTSSLNVLCRDILRFSSNFEHVSFNL